MGATRNVIKFLEKFEETRDLAADLKTEYGDLIKRAQILEKSCQEAAFFLDPEKGVGFPDEAAALSTLRGALGYAREERRSKQLKAIDEEIKYLKIAQRNNWIDKNDVLCENCLKINPEMKDGYTVCCNEPAYEVWRLIVNFENNRKQWIG